MSTKAQRQALREDPRVREQLPTLADALDLVAQHEEARAAFALWWSKVNDEFHAGDLKEIEGFPALADWLYAGERDA